MSANVFKHRALFCTLLANGCVRTTISAVRRMVYTKTDLKNFPHKKNSIVFCRPCKLTSSIQIRLHGTVAAETSPAVTFDHEQVQELLKRMTGRDFDKIFAVRVEELEVPKYQLMSDDELHQV